MTDRALRALNRAIRDRATAHPLAAWLTDNMPDLGAFDAIGALVEDAEAEGSRLIGARTCDDFHGTEAPDGAVAVHPALLPCPSCGAAL